MGFAFGIGMKLFVEYAPSHPVWLAPFANQAIINWAFCVVVCAVVSLLTAPPRAEQVDQSLMINWSALSVGSAEMGTHWYNHVLTWWLVFVGAILGLGLFFSGLVF